MAIDRMEEDTRSREAAVGIVEASSMAGFVLVKLVRRCFAGRLC